MKGERETRQGLPLSAAAAYLQNVHTYTCIHTTTTVPSVVASQTITLPFHVLNGHGPLPTDAGVTDGVGLMLGVTEGDGEMVAPRIHTDICDGSP